MFPYFWKHPYAFCILSFFFLDDPPMEFLVGIGLSYTGFQKRTILKTRMEWNLILPNKISQKSQLASNKMKKSTHLKENSGKQLAVFVFDIWN